MDLTPKEQKTLADLKKYRGFTSPEEVIEWCKFKLTQHYAIRVHKNCRKHSLNHYKNIISFLSKGSV